MNKNKPNIKKAIKGMGGRKPLNPIGSCFDSSLHLLLHPELNQNIINLKDVKLCHGIGITNMPEQEGHKMAHAWLEYTHEDGVRVAIDTTWGVATQAEHYRKTLKLNYVIEYTPEKATKLWETPAPWDDKIRQVAFKSDERKDKK